MTESRPSHHEEILLSHGKIYGMQSFGRRPDFLQISAEFYSKFTKRQVKVTGILCRNTLV
jgi:hypothetical protein